jgi:anti-anti-sigma factor
MIHNIEDRMKVTIRSVKNCQVFDIEGPLTIDDAERIESVIYKKLNTNLNTAVINLGGTSYITSPILGSLVRIQRTIKEKGVKLALMGSNPELMNLFVITGTAQFFSFYRDEDELM